MKTKQVALLIESSRSYGRGLLAGVATYMRADVNWAVSRGKRTTPVMNCNVVIPIQFNRPTGVGSQFRAAARLGWRSYRPIKLKNNFLALFTVALVTASATAEHGSPIGKDLDYNRDIRPILSDKCYFCHGPGHKTREADLRLDSREEAGYVIDSGDLVDLITSDDPAKFGWATPRVRATWFADHSVRKMLPKNIVIKSKKPNSNLW